MEPGHRRQFDVVGRVDGILSHTYEARDHERKVDITQIEAFHTKNATLTEKPRVAGIISSKGFWKKPIEWVRHYSDRMLVQELYQLRPSVPIDWAGDLRQVQIESIGKSAKVLPVRILYGDSLPENAGKAVTLTSWRGDSFVKDAKGRVIGNLLDIVNHESRIALSSGLLGRRVVPLPESSHLTIGECTRNVIGLEIEFEVIAIPSTVLVDHSGRFPDTLIDALTGQQWLIHDQARALKASRTGYDLTLEFTDPDNKALFDIADLPPVPEFGEVGVPRNLGERMAAVALHAALAVVHVGAKTDEIPVELTDVLHSASAAMDSHDYSEAERLYKESLSLGTALAALCGLGYLAK